MAEINSPVNIKEKINAIRSIVPNKSNNEIVLVLQQFDNNVDKAVQAFMDGSATQVLKEWNMTGKKKNNRRKRSKSKQHQGNKDPKNKNGPEKASQEPQGIHDCHMNGCSKDNSCRGSANQKLETTSLENKGSGFVGSALDCPEIRDRERECQRLSVELSPKNMNGVEQHEPPQSSVQLQCNLGRPKSKSSSVKSSNATTQLETKTDDSVKKRGPNIEKSVKDLQRCTVSLTRYRVMIKEEVDNSVKKIKAAFAELHSCIVDKEVSLMAEIDKVKEEAMEILTARQKKAEELKRLTDLASQMAEAQLSELRAEIKHFVSERKYDEELGRSARFSCDTEQLKTQIQLCGEISHPKNNYSSRTPCSLVLSSMTSHATTGKQNTHTRKSSSNAKNSDNKTASIKVQSHLSSNPTESSSQGIPTNKQNGPSSQRRRFNPQHQNMRLNGSLKAQGASNEADQNTKSGARSEHRRQQHNSFRSKNKGAMKNQEQSTTARTTENPIHSEKTRRKHHTPDAADHRPFQGSVGRVSQCNLCPARREVSADATVLSVPTVTLVA
ncbi:PREDICTED: SPATS2-like protein [Lepidothrix coronata]|uniref:SPATS2-like protein n=1 Tax=Lepidothrix coronata TaxID=321398 RepID=A0A6J0IYG8_9PASS|nr:PREDICTED: SPATS2-like protein [Lepidothrix coronata]XP_017691701.1 PREDICTED: SPATS2-like protein [Lepidothrix coronata]XP_017691708.1 PREDICTED: SPATS2-like protein [Lepidothrix coronata]XP_017691718.1 PREDICTED: SPATS2-like protein [Lepidothrix coronata]XP_017691728.1 PREDICTED: SPATS2-like protein [Lepidothrix coronata]XP_017691736.1 PREDICTED: SPATS2-like protein [Lepidothrix coronata]